MNKTAPKVTIALPVYNGEDYLAEALDTLLAQTFEDFELIVSDNASTDTTESICRQRANADPRIRYVRNETNIGAVPNFNRVVELARGKYFKWAAHDDMHDPRYVKECVTILDQDPSVVLAYPRVKDIDENGEFIRNKSYGLRTNHPVASVRFRDLIRMDYGCEAIFGLVRIEVLRRTPLLGRYADCDRVLLTEIGLSGRIHEVPEYLFIHRHHKGRSVMQFTSRQTRTAWFDPSKEGKAAYPYTREFLGYLAAVRRAPIPFSEKLKCHGLMLRWIVVNAPLWIEDYTYAARLLLRPIKHKLLGPPENRTPKRGENG